MSYAFKIKSITRFNELKDRKMTEYYLAEDLMKLRTGILRANGEQG